MAQLLKGATRAPSSRKLSVPQSQSNSTQAFCIKVRSTPKLDEEAALIRSVCITGELQSVDGYMNIALEKTAEYVNGQLRRNYGDAFVRGNNGIVSYIFEYSVKLLTGA